jgi:hypothetical protein
MLWQADHRETRAEIQARGCLFMEQVMARPETHIAVSQRSSGAYGKSETWLLWGMCWISGRRVGGPVGGVAVLSTK